MQLKAIIFDVGGTLISYHETDSKLGLEKGCVESFEYLRSNNLAEQLPDYGTYRKMCIPCIGRRRFWADIRTREFNMQAMLRHVAKRLRMQISTDKLIDWEWAWYNTYAEGSEIHPNTCAILQNLKETGVKLGIISNTQWSPAVMEKHFKQLDFLDFFPIRTYSSITGYMKPHRKIYLDTLLKLEVKPAEALMIGDMYPQDIYGAEQAGLTAIMIKPKPDSGRIVPKSVSTIGDITELPEMISKLTKQHDSK